MEIKVYMRHTQYFAVIGTPQIPQNSPIIYTGPNPASIVPTLGTVPIGTFFDVSEDVANLDAIQLTWTKERDEGGVAVPGALLPKKSASNSVLIEGKTYQFIKDWLIKSVAAPLNAIDVKIEMVGCGFFEDFCITSDQITWCEDGVCEFSVTFKQKDAPLQCLQQTLISDNWQGWFQTQPANGKKHPRFNYCNEIRPNGLLIVQWWFIGTIASTLILTLFPIIILLNGIIAVLNVIIGVILSIIDAISWLFGGSPDFGDNFNTIDFIGPDAFFSRFTTFFVESSGCGRMHPAPFIRDYIDNVCLKCGIAVDAVTSPIFHSQTITLEASSGLKNNVQNPYYNSTYLTATKKRGIRVFRNLFGNSDRNETDYYIPENRPILALDQFLDEIKGVYNAQWTIRNVQGQPTLYIWRKDWFRMDAAIYDFTDNAEDRKKIIQGICFNWLDRAQFAVMRGLYAEDAADTCGNEALSYMNGTIALGDKTNNPNIEGTLDKTVQFGATKFRLDGISTDYICDAAQVVLNGQFLTPSLFSVIKNALNAITPYGDYALLLKDETCTLPKILIWEPSSGLDYAKAIRNKRAGGTSTSTLPLPTINPMYNDSVFPYDFEHVPSTHVLGSSFSFGSNPIGQYIVQEYFGIDAYSAPAELCNYPMFFDPEYTDNIFDWFHWIDDPRKRPTMNLQFDLKIELCCEDLEKLKAFGDGSEIKLGSKLLLPLDYYNEGEITEITASFDSEQDVGKYIQLKGIV